MRTAPAPKQHRRNPFVVLMRNTEEIKAQLVELKELVKHNPATAKPAAKRKASTGSPNTPAAA